LREPRADMNGLRTVRVLLTAKGSGLSHMEEALFRQSAGQCAQVGRLPAGIDAARASEAFGDDGGHIGLGKTLEQQVWLLRVYHRVDSDEDVSNLSHAVVDLRLIPFLRGAPVMLIGSVKTLLARSHHHCSDLQHRAAIGAIARCERPIVSIDFIEMINDGIAIDQCFATIKHQRRDAAKWVAGAHLNAVVEAGERTLFKRHTINIESDRNASRKW